MTIVDQMAQDADRRRALARDVDRLETTLLARFSPPLRPETVQHCLDECIALFELSTVRNYLAILIERTATDRLRAEVERGREGDRGGCLVLAGGSELGREHVHTGKDTGRKS
jgi:hypothetical protein